MLLAEPALFCFGQAGPKPVIPVNYDEALTGSYRLPDPLVLANGKPVRDAKTWYTKRRPELIHLFETEQYGRSPAAATALSFDVFDKGTPAFGGKAVRKQIEIHFSPEASGPKADLAMYLPAGADKPAPVLLYISFSANSTTIEDPVKSGTGRRSEYRPAKAEGSELLKSRISSRQVLAWRRFTTGISSRILQVARDSACEDCF
jgi:hypothetical protein